MALGLRRAGDDPVGFVAVIARLHAGRPPCGAAFLLAMTLALPGCTAAPRLIGVASGAIAGGATANPAIGFAVGVASDAATNAGARYVSRAREAAEQDAIAAVAGGLPVGGEAPWRIDHTIPIGNEHGNLKVVRLIDNPLAPCKEIAFSVVEGEGPTAPRRWYTADMCRQGQTWAWATAEPAVTRWGYLQ